ncbi:tellurite resistance/C4-dicarboxylate transporter family protein [Sediminibacillus halophilus]|uniref:Tellurite resistance protein TehA n=1 Tax=Sediminibacillus halophilus TaxID=482461 RepID=A0A1G9VH41_9BACI|nr:tellurite resistance/C4-dicarboxylate transporter family protein [Sediminibacillus halophilus]SDM71430.1 Tellurite resistance protein TehA [Sediminibacillus halophilus]
MKAFIKQTAAELFPGYFAMVMATGALSIAAEVLGIGWIATPLLVSNIIVYTLLWILTLIRLIGYFPRLAADFANHAKGPGFFTLIAGTCMLGSQSIIVTGSTYLAFWLWGVGLVLWLAIMYSFFTIVTVQQATPTLEMGINGAWLLAVVAAQSLSVLGSLLAETMGTGKQVMLFLTLSLHLAGCMLYFILITLIFYRFIFLRMEHTELTPPYWINMGAVAISAMAGCTLLLHGGGWQLLESIRPFLTGFTLFFWVFGTWWTPLLVILFIWRHLYHRYPLSYEPQQWGMVFPLAMYTISTFYLATVLHLDFLFFLPEVMVYVAMTAWLAVTIGLLRQVIKKYRTYVAGGKQMQSYR